MLEKDESLILDQKRIEKKQKVYSCLQEYIDIAKEVYGESLEKVILFGSYARGDFKEESDVDLLLLIDVSPKRERKKLYDLIDRTFDIKLDNDLDIEPITKSIYTFNKWKDVLPFYKNIENEGEILYDAKAN